MGGVSGLWAELERMDETVPVVASLLPSRPEVASATLQSGFRWHMGLESAVGDDIFELWLALQDRIRRRRATAQDVHAAREKTMELLWTRL